jgi:hypothetical protein
VFESVEGADECVELAGGGREVLVLGIESGWVALRVGIDGDGGWVLVSWGCGRSSCFLDDWGVSDDGSCRTFLHDGDMNDES